MITDKLPRKNKDEYLRSDSLKAIQLPPAEPVRTHARQMEEALAREDRKAVQISATAIGVAFSGAYDIPAPKVRILGVRPREVTETSVTETFGDYDTETHKIRLWMRTAVLQKPTAFGTFLSTLCHELCHHLDVVHLDLENTYHTRGFYERAGLLYHYIRATPVRQLVWTEQKGGRYNINWPETMRGSTRAT